MKPHSHKMLLNEALPLLAFSYSSKGFRDLATIVSNSLSHLPSFLLSLYDYHYQLEKLDIINSEDSRIRIWDSGGYEISDFEDVSAILDIPPNAKSWTKDMYVEVANRIPWNGNDVLVSFDSVPYRQAISIDMQIEDALKTYETITGKYLKDMLVHVQERNDVKNIAKALTPYLSNIDILGFTEKEIAPTWERGVKFILELRTELQSVAAKIPPIHLFGCFDPKSIIYFTLAGVSIFDGLTWQRYFIEGLDTYYVREYEYKLKPADLSDIKHSGNLILRNNVQQLVNLSNDLKFFLQTNDANSFIKFRERIQLIQGGNSI